ncbi:hypothetical protein [Paraburkholderia megapolitana]|uniref:Cation transport ATPase n=1 Tax=Paraburkholderia megapolitana TaxID=420953 RepID=A0A1I3Q1X0_9BURK|nr:hypothetical protein [Paraburkholderia megapolitana]QDQ81092.1 hypothetical protein FNZ07_07825 [Paraburkholderia megapolitana]SFJ27848.1 hypothetical protein SAMN05192543_106180 [Paraburkholderia megapolitana]
MGVGMHIVYLGFAGSIPIEAEAGVQLVRLERFAGVLAGCHLAIEALKTPTGQTLYDARLDLMTRVDGFTPIGHCSSPDPREAVRQAFDAAERLLGDANRELRRSATE